MRLFKYTVLSLVALLVSTGAFASGKLIVQPNYLLDQQKFGGQVGLAVFEPLSVHKNFFINSYTGFGTAPWETRDTTHWLTVKNTFEMPLMNWKMIVGVGFQLNYSVKDHDFNNNVHAKISYQLW